MGGTCVASRASLSVVTTGVEQEAIISIKRLKDIILTTVTDTLPLIVSFFIYI
jgi:hypothetical protein